MKHFLDYDEVKAEEGKRIAQPIIFVLLVMWGFMALFPFSLILLLLGILIGAPIIFIKWVSYSIRPKNIPPVIPRDVPPVISRSVADPQKNKQS